MFPFYRETGKGYPGRSMFHKVYILLLPLPALRGVPFQVLPAYGRSFLCVLLRFPLLRTSFLHLLFHLTRRPGQHTLCGDDPALGERFGRRWLWGYCRQQPLGQRLKTIYHPLIGMSNTFLMGFYQLNKYFEVFIIKFRKKRSFNNHGKNDMIRGKTSCTLPWLVLSNSDMEGRQI